MHAWRQQPPPALCGCTTTLFSRPTSPHPFLPLSCCNVRCPHRIELTSPCPPTPLTPTRMRPHPRHLLAPTHGKPIYCTHAHAPKQPPGSPPHMYNRFTARTCTHPRPLSAGPHTWKTLLLHARAHTQGTSRQPSTHEDPFTARTRTYMRAHTNTNTHTSAHTMHTATPPYTHTSCTPHARAGPQHTCQRRRPHSPRATCSNSA